MNKSHPAGGRFTGRHMLAIMVAFFGVIIGVNVTMATVAGTSWTGFVVKNSYVASQQFNGKVAEARAQAALGWTPTLTIAAGGIRFALADAAGRPVAIESANVSLRRPSYEAEDFGRELKIEADGSASVAQSVRDGLWIVEIVADVGRDKPYRHSRRIVVDEGVMQ